MYPDPESSTCSRLKGRATLTVAALAAAVCAFASGCSAHLPSQQVVQPIPPATVPVVVQPAPEVTQVIAPAIIVPAPTESSVSEQTLRVLTYAERVRLLQGPELVQEINRQTDNATPAGQIQLALAMSQLRQLPELLKAQELLVRVLANPAAAPLHPLARLLASRFAEQRRLEEQIERQNQQVRDTQRRLDQTNERLEALKAIERSLVSRPPGASSAPAPGRNRSAP